MKINFIGFKKILKFLDWVLEHGVWVQTLMVKFLEKKVQNYWNLLSHLELIFLIHQVYMEMDYQKKIREIHLKNKKIIE